jgi:hypothetical protein
MAEVLASLKKIGGSGEQYTETSLWLNPNQSPTTSTTFAAQTVELSDNIRNYKYIAIRFFGDTGISNRVIYNVSDYVTFRWNGNTTHNIGALQFQSATSNYTYARLFYYVDDTHVGFTLDYGVNRAVNYQTANIPLEILGINELAHAKGLDETTTLWTNANPTAEYSGGDVTLSDDINNYDYIKIKAALNNGTWSNILSSFSIEVSEFIKSLSDNSGYINSIAGRHLTTTTINYSRFVQYKGATTVNISQCIMTTGTTSIAVRNGAMIPLQIIGCKFR